MIKARQLRVAVFIESSRAYGRGLLLGVAKYLREHAGWQVDYQERDLRSPIPSWLNEWKGDGVLARVEDQAMARAIQKLGVPAVDLRRKLSDLKMPSVHDDDEKTVRLAAAHLIERNFRHFAFCGFVGADYSDSRSRVFEKYITEAGYNCHVYNPPRPTSHTWTMEYEQDGLIYEDDMVHWLQRLPKPIGIMTCNDIRGQQVLNACRKTGVTVPDQVAVIGVDNDEVLCELAGVPLTSVALNTVRIGYEACELLERMMAGETLTPVDTDIAIEPFGVVTRRSTDTIVIPHPAAAKALSFLRCHYREPITLKDVAAHMGVSLRGIQDIFKAHVGRSLHGELGRLRVNYAKELLQDRKLKLDVVAAEAGFGNRRCLSRTFEAETGQTPQQYRREQKVE